MEWSTAHLLGTYQVRRMVWKSRRLGGELQSKIFEEECFSYVPAKIWWWWSHSQIWSYFISYLLTCEVDLFEVLEIMAQMWHYIIFLSHKPTKVTSDFIWNYLKKQDQRYILRSLSSQQLKDKKFVKKNCQKNLSKKVKKILLKNSSKKFFEKILWKSWKIW